MIVAQITALKLAWTLASFLGVIITFALLFMAVTDYRLLLNINRNGWRKQVALTSIFIFIGGFITMLVYFVSGVLSLTQSNTTGSSVAIRHTTQALFLFGALSSIILALVIFLRRLHIIRIIENAISEEGDHTHRRSGDT